jgi:prophage regulatory protein
MRYIREKEVQQRTGMSRTTRWRLEKTGNFPRKRKLSTGLVGWVEAEIEEWLKTRPTAGGSK